MRIGIFLGFMVATVFIFYLGSTSSLADSSTYHIKGYVTDGLTGPGIPGAKVTLFINAAMGSHGAQAITDSGNPVYTSNNSTNEGYFEFNISQPGSYQVFAEKDGLNGSVNRSDGWSSIFSVSAGTGNYMTSVVLMLTMPSVSPTVTVAPTPTATPGPTVTPTPTPSTVVTPSPVNSTSTPSPAPSDTVTPVPMTIDTPPPMLSNTPAPSPGIIFSFIPALLVICLIALRKRN